MLEEFINRENEIFDILQKFVDAGLDFIVVGDYAVSAYKHRFSVDADVVTKEEERFADLLKKNGFVKTISKELAYPLKFIRYEKRRHCP